MEIYVSETLREYSGGDLPGLIREVHVEGRGDRDGCTCFSKSVSNAKLL